MTRQVSITAPVRTIENPQYMIPTGTYTMGLHRWTKSGKLVPILENVPRPGSGPAAMADPSPMRSYILMHNGSRPEHSKGCLLAPQSVIDALVTLITYSRNSNEKVSITISDNSFA